MQREDSFDAVKNNIVLSDYISTHTGAKLTKHGQRFRGSCPLHGGSNTSGFSVDDHRGLWKCFTDDCGGGSIFDFWMKLNDNDNIMEALEALAKEGNVKLSKTAGKKVENGRLYDAVDAIVESCHNYLMRSKEPDAVTMRKYLEDRGVDKPILRDRKIGMLPSGRKASIDFIERSCPDTEALVEAGIIGARDKSVWVPQSGRLMFPIFDGKGRPVAFGARAVEGVPCQKSESKYINTTLTPIYDKSKILYGMEDVSKTTNHIVIVEGYLDVIGAMETTDDNKTVALATCGTGFTSGHANFVARSSKSQEFAFDGDAAGKKAIASALSVISDISKDVTATLLPEGDDPWDMYLRGDSVFDYCEKHRGPVISVATKARFEASKDESEFLDWVSRTIPTLSYSSQKSEMTTIAAKLVGKTAASLRRGELSRVSRKSVKGEGRLTGQSILSPQTREFIKGLMQMDDDSRDAALTVFRPWKKHHVAACEDMLPIETKDDLHAFRKIVLGVDARSSEEIDRELADLMSTDDEDRVNMNHIQRGIGTQALAALSDKEIIDSYLPDNIREIRLCSTLSFSPGSFATLMDIVVDESRVSLEMTRKKRLSRTGS